MSKLPPWLLVLVLGCALLLPMLGSFGLWDPQEIREADVAQEMARTGNFSDVTLGGRYQKRPVLTVWLVALGFKLLGVNESAGRLPLAVCGIFALLIGYRVTRRLVGPRAALIGVFALLTTPTFIFQSRQLVSEVVYYAAILASVGGLAAYLWPATGRRSTLDLVLGGLGLVAGFLAAGLLVGTLFPLFGVMVAVALSWHTPNRPDESEALPPEPPPDTEPEAPAADPYRTPGRAPRGDEAARLDVTPATTVGQATRAALVPLLVTLAASAALIGSFFALLKQPSILVLGSEVRRVAIPPTFETALKDLGWSFFPWFALVPMVLIMAVLTQRRDPRSRHRSAFPYMLVLVLGLAGYLLVAIGAGYLNKMRFPALPWLAMGVGLVGYQLLQRSSPVHRVWALVAVVVVLVIRQDYFMAPESLAFSHLLSHAKYPIDLSIKLYVNSFGLLFAAAFFFSLGGVPRPLTVWQKRTAPSSRLRDSILDGLREGGRWLAIGVDSIGLFLRWIVGRNGRIAQAATAVLALAFAGWCSFWLTPHLSLHLSNKALFQVFHRCRTGQEKLAQYQVPGRGAAYYNDGQIEEVGSQTQLFQLLKQPERWFILMPASHLASVDQAARRSSLEYHVLDDRSSQYLLLSNKLEGKCNQDHNPLRRFVLSSPPKPRKPLVANFENRVKLLGYDVADAVTRGGKFQITLYFQVLGQMPSGYKLFLHFDQPANRFHGDHEPLDGKYPTQYWLPGDYIVDPHDVEIPLITTPSGRYTIYVGFWLGSQRLKVIEGPNDGVNRVRLGTLRVR